MRRVRMQARVNIDEADLRWKRPSFTAQHRPIAASSTGSARLPGIPIWRRVQWRSVTLAIGRSGGIGHVDRSGIRFRQHLGAASLADRFQVIDPGRMPARELNMVE